MCLGAEGVARVEVGKLTILSIVWRWPLVWVVQNVTIASRKFVISKFAVLAVGVCGARQTFRWDGRLNFSYSSSHICSKL